MSSGFCYNGTKSQISSSYFYKSIYLHLLIQFGQIVGYELHAGDCHLGVVTYNIQMLNIMFIPFFNIYVLGT